MFWRKNETVSNRVKPCQRKHRAPLDRVKPCQTVSPGFSGNLRHFGSGVAGLNPSEPHGRSLFASKYSWPIDCWSHWALFSVIVVGFNSVIHIIPHYIGSTCAKSIYGPKEGDSAEERGRQSALKGHSNQHGC